MFENISHTAPARCSNPRCALVFESGLLGIMMVGNSTTCPRCGAHAPIADMIYREESGRLVGYPTNEESQAIVRDFLSYFYQLRLKDRLSRTQISDIKNTLLEARAAGLSESETVRRIKSIDDQFASMIVKFGLTPTTLPIYIALLAFIISIMQIIKDDSDRELIDAIRDNTKAIAELTHSDEQMRPDQAAPIDSVQSGFESPEALYGAWLTSEQRMRYDTQAYEAQVAGVHRMHDLGLTGGWDQRPNSSTVPNVPSNRKDRRKAKALARKSK